jgi:hypothetical protein
MYHARYRHGKLSQQPVVLTVSGSQLSHSDIERFFDSKLLSVRFSSDGPLLEFSMIIPDDIIGMGMSQLSAGKHLLCMSDHLTGTLNLAVDTRTRVLYRFPPPSSIIVRIKYLGVVHISLIMKYRTLISP